MLSICYACTKDLKWRKYLGTDKWIHCNCVSMVRGPVCQKEVPMAGRSNYIPQYLWCVITCPCPWYLFWHTRPHFTLLYINCADCFSTCKAGRRQWYAGRSCRGVPWWRVGYGMWWLVRRYPDSKVHGANMGPTWGRQDPGGPHVGHMNLAIWIHSVLQTLWTVKPSGVTSTQIYWDQAMDDCNNSSIP